MSYICYLNGIKTDYFKFCFLNKTNYSYYAAKIFIESHFTCGFKPGG